MKILDTYLTKSYNQGENVPWESLKYLIGEVRNILCLVHTTQLLSHHAVHTTQLFGHGSVHMTGLSISSRGPLFYLVSKQ